MHPPPSASETPRMTRLFDSYLIVDWSAASRPKLGADSIWIGRGEGAATAENVATRAAAHASVRARLLTEMARGRRVLAGFDFPYGYPRGFAASLGIDHALPPWLAVWRELGRRIEDDTGNRNNRFAVASALNRAVGPGPGPFWMRPEPAGTPALGLRNPGFPYPSRNGFLREWRETELSLRRTGRYPQSSWKLSGAGSVGSQALVGIPVVRALREDPELAAVSRVWPFEADFREIASPNGPRVVHAEIWPGVVDVRPGPGEVRDAAQVRALVAEFARRDDAGTLAALFAPETAPSAASEEGWILGS